jgi:hypothetical protein
MDERHLRLRADVEDEMAAIDQALDDLRRLYAVTDKINADNQAKAAIGTFLMNFYVGVENVLKRICRGYYGHLPQGESWHREILEFAQTPPENKAAIFTKDIVDRLNPYRGFRHVFVSGYGFKLRLDLMASLCENADNLWRDIKQSLELFWNKI